MSDGCQCEYLSERAGGAAVVCQYCHDVAKAEIKRLRAALDAPPGIPCDSPEGMAMFDAPQSQADPREAFEAWRSATLGDNHCADEILLAAFEAGFAAGRGI